mgnify:CR=1 FL=1
MDIQVKTYDQLTKDDLYKALQLRAEVFVVEQDCVYQDIDGKDERALHVLGYKDNGLVAYTRLFKSGDYFKEASIGRVVVKEVARKEKLGYAIMEKSIQVINEQLKEDTIHISAQTYLKNFYNSLGFKETGNEYLEDGIPHIGMVLKKH